MHPFSLLFSIHHHAAARSSKWIIFTCYTPKQHDKWILCFCFISLPLNNLHFHGTFKEVKKWESEREREATPVTWLGEATMYAAVCLLLSPCFEVHRTWFNFWSKMIDLWFFLSFFLDWRQTKKKKGKPKLKARRLILQSKSNFYLISVASQQTNNLWKGVTRSDIKKGFFWHYTKLLKLAKPT